VQGNKNDNSEIKLDKYKIMKIDTMRKPIVILFYISILMFFSSCNKCKIDNQTTIFKDVNIIPMCNDSILYGHSVLVKDGKIVDISFFKEMDIPEDAQIIDGKEKYLIPGLCDMHVHIADVDDRILYVANGVTLIRNMSGFPYHLELREKIKEKRLIGPEIYTTGLLIDGSDPYWPKASIVINDKEKVYEVLSQMKNDGYDAIKIYERLTKEVYDEIIRVAKKLEMPVVGHVPYLVGLKEVLISGQTSIEHLDDYGNYYSDEQIISETVKSGIWNCPTLMVLKNYENLDSLKENPPFEIKYVYPSLVEYWKSLNQLDMGFANKLKLLNTLTNNKANIVAGTDAGTAFVVNGFCLHDELSLMQDAGLTPYQILISATINCAKMLGYESRLGTIEKGKDADLVLLMNNPLEDIKNTKSIAGVMTKGNWYPKKELNSMLEKVAVKRNPLKQKSTIHNNVFMKLIMLLLTLTFLSTFLIQPILYVLNRNKFKSLINDNALIKKYRIRFFVISVSFISIILLFLIITLPDAVFQSGLPSTLIGLPELTKYQILLPFVNLIFMVALLTIYTIRLIKRELSAYRKWHTLSIISASIILLVLVNYWGLLRLYL
jgi:imidazolonepropionase-like amidohydrolase